MHARAFNFLCLLGILAIIFALISPSVIAAPAAESDLEESAFKPGLKISGLLKASLDNRQVGDACGPVTGANVGGTCLNANTQCCNGFYSVGFCPGPSNIRCCTEFQECSGGGFCNDVNHVSCSVPYVANLCPGPSNVRCCRGASGESFCTAGGP